MSDADFFPAIVSHFENEAERAAIAERIERVVAHRRSMSSCWPQWDARLRVGSRIECHSVTNELACDATEKRLKGTLFPRKKGERLYTYCAPCKIVRVLDSETFIAEIDYSPKQIAGAPHVACYNGLTLKLDILDIWPPVAQLIARRIRNEKRQKRQAPARVAVAA